MRLIKKGGTYFFSCKFEEKNVPKAARFYWDATVRMWRTENKEKACLLIGHVNKNEDPELYEELFAELGRARDETPQTRAPRTRTRGSGRPSIEYVLPELDKEAIAASMATTSNFPVPAPRGLAYMPFQLAGIEYGIKRHNVLLGDPPGVGKTIQAIGILNKLYEDREVSGCVLVIVPPSLRINWEKELAKWLVPFHTVVTLNSRNTRNMEVFKRVGLRVYIVGYTTLNKLKWLNDVNWDVLIGDEAHYAKNRNAQRSKNFYKLAKRSKRRIFLTGTAIVNKPIEVFPLAKALGLGMPYDFFAERYCEAAYNPWSRKIDAKGADNLEELQAHMRAKFMIRRRKSEVLKDLPPKTRQVVVLPESVASEQVKQERMFAMSRNISFEDIAEMKFKFGADIGEISKLRHDTAVAKAPAVADFCEELLESEDKLVVFAHHIDVVNILCDRFRKYGVVKVVGGMSDTAKDASVVAFQTGTQRVAVLNITAGGLGFTFTRASICVFAEDSWVPGDITQAEDRLHRKGQEGNVLAYHVLVENSIDMYIANRVIEKQEILDRTLEQDRMQAAQVF